MLQKYYTVTYILVIDVQVQVDSGRLSPPTPGRYLRFCFSSSVVDTIPYWLYSTNIRLRNRHINRNNGPGYADMVKWLRDLVRRPRGQTVAIGFLIKNQLFYMLRQSSRAPYMYMICAYKLHAGRLSSLTPPAPIIQQHVSIFAYRLSNMQFSTKLAILNSIISTRTISRLGFGF